MPLRITDTANNAQFIRQVNASRQRLNEAQEQIGTGKRVNYPSDDPISAGIVIRTRTTQAAVEQFKRNAGLAQDSLLAADTVLDSYEVTLDRLRSLLTSGASDTVASKDRSIVATEVEGLRTHILGLANRQNGNQFLFGGTRQEAPPYDNTGVPAATPTAQQFLQIDPEGIPLPTGVTADTIFEDASGTIFQTLDDAAAALRGTGDEAADRTTILNTLDRMLEFTDLARIARTQLGTGLTRVETVTDQLTDRSLALEATAQRAEGADFVEAALNLNNAQQVFEALLQTKANSNHRSLIDLLG